MSQLGTEAAPLRVAVVGAGPSGFYATEALLKSEVAAQVDLIERLPSPYGLVRSGVAPDHPKLKQSIEVYKKVAALEGFRFFGNVTVGKDVTPQELRDIYHAVIYTCGAETDRRLGIEGEDLTGSHTATEFVGWYNGHPDYRDREFDFSHETAVIIGQGNVAADVARILSKSVDELKHTDISQHALDALVESQIKTIAVVGRRGPAQAKFTTKELREFLELENCQAAIASEELALNEASQTEVADKKAGVVAAKNMAVFEKMAENAEHGKGPDLPHDVLPEPDPHRREWPDRAGGVGTQRVVRRTVFATGLGHGRDRNLGVWAAVPLHWLSGSANRRGAVP